MKLSDQFHAFKPDTSQIYVSSITTRDNFLWAMAKKILTIQPIAWGVNGAYRNTLWGFILVWTGSEQTQEQGNFLNRQITSGCSSRTQLDTYLAGSFNCFAEGPRWGLTMKHMCNEQVLCSMHNETALLHITPNSQKGKVANTTFCYQFVFFLHNMTQTHSIKSLWTVWKLQLFIITSASFNI
jgi:hypothetical protein